MWFVIILVIGLTVFTISLINSNQKFAHTNKAQLDLIESLQKSNLQLQRQLTPSPKVTSTITFNKSTSSKPTQQVKKTTPAPSYATGGNSRNDDFYHNPTNPFSVYHTTDTTYERDDDCNKTHSRSYDDNYSSSSSSSYDSGSSSYDSGSSDSGGSSGGSD